METYKLQELENLNGLVSRAQMSDEPLIVFDEDDECLIAMRPSVFERILFDSDLLNSGKRETLHL